MAVGSHWTNFINKLLNFFHLLVRKLEYNLLKKLLQLLFNFYLFSGSPQHLIFISVHLQNWRFLFVPSSHHTKLTKANNIKLFAKSIILFTKVSERKSNHIWKMSAGTKKMKKPPPLPLILPTEEPIHQTLIECVTCWFSAVSYIFKFWCWRKYC